MLTILDLVPDIYHNVFNFLGLMDVISLRFINKFFNKIFILDETLIDLIETITFIVTIKGPQNFTLKQLYDTKILDLDNDYGETILENGTYIYPTYICTPKNLNLPRGLGKLPNLEELHLQGNGINHIPPELGNLYNLKILTLHDNNINTLPPELYKLHNLKVLYLGHNKLNTFPLGLLNMPNLTELYIFNNNFGALPEFNNVNGLTIEI